MGFAPESEVRHRLRAGRRGFELLVPPLEIHRHGSPERRTAPKAFGHYMHQSSPLRHLRAATLAVLKIVIDNLRKQPERRASPTCASIRLILLSCFGSAGSVDQGCIALASSRVEAKLFSVMNAVRSPKHRSTRFIHEDEVGVSCMWNRGCRPSHFLPRRCSWVAQLSAIIWMSRSAGLCSSISWRKASHS
jgi:hypothetical protein